MKVAKLVYTSFVTRVIVEENSSEEQILEAAKSKLLEQVKYDLAENLEEIKNDTEVPYSQNEGKPIDTWEEWNKLQHKGRIDRMFNGLDRGK